MLLATRGCSAASAIPACIGVMAASFERANGRECSPCTSLTRVFEKLNCHTVPFAIETTPIGTMAR